MEKNTNTGGQACKTERNVGLELNYCEEMGYPFFIFLQWLNILTVQQDQKEVARDNQ